jgi:hypothetical protein
MPQDMIERIIELRRMPYKEYLLTPEWLARRAAAISLAGGKCSLCNGATETFNVHHRTYERRGAELPNDLICLCRPCHEKQHDISPASDVSVFEKLHCWWPDKEAKNTMPPNQAAASWWFRAGWSWAMQVTKQDPMRHAAAKLFWGLWEEPFKKGVKYGRK